MTALFTQLRHPERSRFSGGAKDLPLTRPNAQAKLRHYPSVLTLDHRAPLVYIDLSGLTENQKPPPRRRGPCE